MSTKGAGVGISAGWYPDESMPGFDRYWDGSWWTPQTRESAVVGQAPPAPPPPPVATTLPSADQAPESAEPVSLLKMSVDEFKVCVGDVAKREYTYPALLVVRQVEIETFQRAQQIMADHLARAGRAVVRPQIQALVAWQKERYQPAMTSLGDAMQRDFDKQVNLLGGPMFLPVPIDDAWANYIEPLKWVLESIRDETATMLGAVAQIEDEYLFV